MRRARGVAAAAGRGGGAAAAATLNVLLLLLFLPGVVATSSAAAPVCRHELDTGGGAAQLRVAAYPNGLPHTTMAACCALCAPGNTINCSAWIYQLQSGHCWPMAWTKGTRSRPGIVIGGNIAPGPTPPPPPPPAQLQCSNSSSWWTDRGMTTRYYTTFTGLKSPADCCTQCSRNTSCNAWTYHSSSAECEIAPIATMAIGKDKISGYKVPPVPGPAPRPEPPPAPPSPLPSTGECQYVTDTVYYAESTSGHGTKWHKQTQVTSAGQCCAICRTLPQCDVGNFIPIGGIYGKCSMWGGVNLSHPTHTPNAMACVVKTRPLPPKPAPAGALNVLYIVSDDARPELPSYGQDYVKAPHLAALAARGLTFM
jgi:hypothetical protein